LLSLLITPYHSFSVSPIPERVPDLRKTREKDKGDEPDEEEIEERG
jgi:hypothetical protein